MKNQVLVFLLAGLGMSLSAANIKGHVSDQQGHPIPFATISVLRSDSTLITGAITDNDGNYTLSAPEDAIFQASFIGYNTICGGPDFVLSEETAQIAEVEVKAKRPLIERQLDKLVVNVSESPIATGSSLLNVLKRAPGVRVDKDGNVTVNGKSVEIYIDGRPSYMSGEQLKALLDGTDGSTIEKIEIITNPSAKYDASGQGGIINIKLKRNKMQGLNGTLVANYGGMYFSDVKEWLQQDYLSLNLNYRSQKTYTNVMLNQGYANMVESITIGSSTPDTTTITHNDLKGDFQIYALRVSNDWMIDSVNTFGFIVQVPIIKFGFASEETNVKNFMPQHTGNLNFTHIFDANKDRELTVNVDYSHNNYQSRNILLPLQKNYVDLNTIQKVDIADAKLDFQTKFWNNGMIECGAKYAYSNTDNRMTTDSIFEKSAAHTSHNDFIYSENVAALYITAAKQFLNNKLNLKLGLRGEYTYSVGKWITADSVNRYSYFNLFPTAFVGYNPTEKWGMSASYTRRIKRPTYSILNPFRTYTDAHHYMEGNPSMTPEFNNDVQLNFSWSQYITLTGVFSHTTDMFNQHMTILPNGDGYYTWSNFGTCTTHGVSASFTEIPLVPKYKTMEDGSRMKDGAWLTLTANAGYYNFINRSYDGNYFNQNHYWNASANLTAYLPKMWTISFDGRYSAPLTIGYNYTKQNYGLDFGIRKMFPEKGVILNLNIQDVLRSQIWEEEARGMAEGTSSWWKNNNHQQKVSVTVIWNFGKQEWHKQRKVGNMDESSRLNSGTGIGK